eukprot:8957916-Pyramimonas_sp.AAC.2
MSPSSRKRDVSEYVHTIPDSEACWPIAAAYFALMHSASASPRTIAKLASGSHHQLMMRMMRMMRRAY